MPLYAYKAIDERGKIHKGTLRRVHKKEVQDLLNDRGFYLLRLQEKASVLGFLKLRPRLSDKELEEFCLHAATLERAGVPFVEALETIYDMSQSPSLQEALFPVIEALKKGASLAQAFREETQGFDAVFCSMLAVGEQRGTLASSFESLGQLFQERQMLKSQLWNSLRYPAFLLLMMTGLMSLLMVWVVPQMELFFRSFQRELPPLTRALIEASRHAPLFLEILGGLLILGLGSFWALRGLSRRGALLIDRWRLLIPGIGDMIKKMELQRFLHVFVPLLKRELPLRECLSLASGVLQNLFLQEAFHELGHKITLGASFSHAWSELPLSEPLIGRLAKTGENSGSLAESLSYSLSFLKRDVEALSQKFASLLEPVLILFLGGLMIWIASALFLPLYDQTPLFTS